MLPVRASEARARGDLVSISRSGSTAFVVPNALRELAAESEAAANSAATAERRYLQALVALTVAHAPALKAAIQSAAEVDAAVARARLGAFWRGYVPEVRGGSGIPRFKTCPMLNFFLTKLKNVGRTD